MTDQAIDTCLVAEIEIFVFPAIADVAGGTGRPVGLNTDAEIVDHITLADAQGLIMSGEQDFLTLPVPVGGLHNLACRILVTLQAGACDRRTICKRFVEETAVVGVVGVCGVFGQPVPGISANRRVWLTTTRQAGGNGEQYGDKQKQFAYGITDFLTSGRNQLTVPVDDTDVS